MKEFVKLHIIVVCILVIGSLISLISLVISVKYRLHDDNSLATVVFSVSLICSSLVYLIGGWKSNKYGNNFLETSTIKAIYFLLAPFMLIMGLVCLISAIKTLLLV